MRVQRVWLALGAVGLFGAVAGHAIARTPELFAEPAPFATPPMLPGTPDVATLVAKVKPSVVSVLVEQEVKGEGGDLASEFFGLPSRPESFTRQGQGSGFIIDHAGHVVTNAHVVEGATKVRVKLADDREFKAKVKGRDARLDLAVLEIEGAESLPVSALGSSEDLRVGEYVVAIGNPFGLGHTVTMGIVSAKSRTIGAGPYDDFIQTDASINPGNSGGPLYNLRGQVIGINTAINPQGRGIGFAIPVDAIKEVLPQLLSTGTVRRGKLGAMVQSVDQPLAKALGMDVPKGALVGDVEKGGAGDRAGLHSGDIILAVDGVEVTHSRDLPRLVARHAPGDKVKLAILRDKSSKSIEASLDELTDRPGRK